MYFLGRILGTTACTASGFLLTRKPDVEGVSRWRAYVPEWKRVVTCVLAAGDRDEDKDKADDVGGATVTIQTYFDARQANYRRRFVFQATSK